MAFKGPILIAQSIINELKNISFDVYFFDEIVETSFRAKSKKINFTDRINFQEYDIIHTHMLRPDMYLYLWSKLSFREFPVKISTIHQFIDHDLHIQHSRLKASIASYIWHKSFTGFDTLVTLNQPMFELYRQKFPKKNIVKIANGINEVNDIEEIPINDRLKIEKFRKKGFCLGAAAQITKNKGFHQIIDLLSINRNFCFLLIGEGTELTNLKRQAEELKVSNRILFLGKRNNAKRYFKYFDAFIMASEREGFPVALLEAASQSIPAACSNNAIFTNIFTDNEVVFFERDNIQSLNSALLKLKTEKDFFSRNINIRYKRDYTSKKMASNYLDLYESLLN